MADIYVVLLLVLGVCGGIVAASAILMFIGTRKPVMKWIVNRSLELTSDMIEERL